MAALRLFILLSIVAIAKSQPPNPINQTDLQIAMSDMRTWSYHGFVILLKILNGSLHDREITFLMPSDEELSKVALSLDHLQDYILSHSIPSALLLSHLLHFPNGTLVPSGVTNRMLSIENGGRSSLFFNNARLVTPNVCINSLIKCHGISTSITFDNSATTAVPLHRSLPTPRLFDSTKTLSRTKSSPAIHRKRTPTRL
ncbi:hypothetical protein HS088_TW06G00322 [Tripterygium wilfordii]|uniref:FAS1 domain-containing protein n=2 Tax=Tripterygium wilfordii TaxID=458696 RepID=A0A7J7DII9_TRIWF|nr:hypothetical protein HS088_TW06G00322 [Tripterygium wilfordii]